MVIDTSAVLAILQDEPERRKFAEFTEAADTRSDPSGRDVILRDSTSVTVFRMQWPELSVNPCCSKEQISVRQTS